LSPRARGVLVLCAATALVASGLGWYVSRAERELEGNVPRVGRPAPDFELRRLDGTTVSLSSLRGKVVYVNFWATWCAPCKTEAPALQELYQELNGEGFEILAATIDTPDAEAAVKSFREQYGVGFPILWDSAKEAYGAYGCTGVPETYLVDANGVLAEAYIGPRDWRDGRYARAIRRLLAARSAG
jgi:peroxiredoxin